MGSRAEAAREFHEVLKAELERGDQLFTSQSLKQAAGVLAESDPGWIAPEMVGVHPDIQHKPGTDPLTGLEPTYVVPDSPYNVDLGGTWLLWLDRDYTYWVVDGHHRRAHAMASPSFVSSGAGEGVGVKRLVPYRCLREEDGWTLEAIQELGRRANGDSIEDSDLLILDDSFEILAEDAKGVRIRQKATRADSRNKNRRVYPRKVLQDAIERLRPRLEVGLVLSELEHPEKASVCDASGCGERYVDNPHRKTGRIDAISDVGADGWVTVDRTIMPTEAGRLVSDSYRSKKPMGISMRFACRGKVANVGGNDCFVTDHIEIFTFDDVENPAVEGAGEYSMLSDSEIGELLLLTDSAAHDCSCGCGTCTGKDNDEPPKRQPDGTLGEPFDGEPLNNNTVNPAVIDTEEADDASSMTMRPDAQEISMKQEIRRLLRDFNLKVQKGASVDDLNSANKALADAIEKAYADGEDVSEFHSPYLKIHGDAERVPGFQAGREGPMAVLGNLLGADPDSGWAAKELRDGGSATAATPAHGGAVGAHPLAASTTGDGIGDDDRAFLKQMREQKAAEDSAKALALSVQSKLDELIVGDHPIMLMDSEIKDDIIKTVRSRARSADEVEALLDDQIAFYGKIAAKAKLNALGGIGQGAGNSVTDLGNPLASITRVDEPLPGWGSVVKMLDAVDEHLADNMSLAEQAHWTNPNGPDGEYERKRRERARAQVKPILEQMLLKMPADRISGDSFSGDSLLREAMVMQKAFAMSDSFQTAIATLNNQPTIMMWMLVQAFQDMRFGEFCSASGPGVKAGAGTPGWEERAEGRVFKVPSETYTDPSGYGQGAPPWDFGLTVAENNGIPEQDLNVYWDTFYPVARKIAASATYEVIRAMGGGPLNYSVIARHFYHMALRKARTIDNALGNEMVNTSLEYAAVAVSGETNTTGNSRLPNNSVFPGSGAVSVNLNPTKTAVATIAATDQYVTYGEGNASGGAAVTAALRLLSGGLNTSTRYYGTNAVGPTPIVPPRALLTLTGAGADSASTLNAISVSAPGSAVLGYLGSDGNIYSIPGTTATYAVDYINGVIVFASGVTGAAGVVTTTITLSYSYATNFDYFIADEAMATLATGETINQYYSRLVSKLDTVAAAMGSGPNYVKPDTALMSLNSSAKVVNASIWTPLNKPLGTDLYPNEQYFAVRNGIGMARVNAPWWLGDRGILLTRKGTTRYAIDSPFEVKGPFAKYDSNGLLIAGEGYYGAERSAIFTPQVKNSSGAILQTVSKLIVLYQRPAA